MTKQQTFTVHCSLLAKKNLYRHAGGANVYIPNEVREVLLDIEQSLREQFGMTLPAIHPRVTFRFFVNSNLKDRDNLKTTLLDCMKNAGLIVDDSIAYFNGWDSTAPAVVDSKLKDDEEIAVITMEWEEYEVPDAA